MFLFFVSTEKLKNEKEISSDIRTYRRKDSAIVEMSVS